VTPWPVALHEAGHAVADWLLLGRVPALVTVAAAGAHAGVAVFDPPLVVDLAGHDPDTPAFLADPRLRADAERAIVALLAGRAAESLAPPEADGYADDSPPPGAADLAGRLARLSPRDRELLADAEGMPGPTADAPLSTDRAVALGLSGRLVGAEEARLHLAWLGAVAHTFVERHRAPIVALARELMARHVMTATEISEILDITINTSAKEAA